MRGRYEAAYGPGTYSLDQFNADVQQALRACFGNPAVHPENKCVTVAAGSGRLSADVVICAQYRRYERFRSMTDQKYAEGITFWGRSDNQQVINEVRAGQVGASGRLQLRQLEEPRRIRPGSSA